jgi:hypothetical protein
MRILILGGQCFDELSKRFVSKFFLGCNRAYIADEVFQETPIPLRRYWTVNVTVVVCCNVVIAALVAVAATVMV